MVEKDSFDHVVKTTAQWESQSFEYWIIPRGVLCVELTPDKKTKIKIGEGNKIYSQLPYINSETDLSDYYTKEEIDNILAMLNFVAIPSSEIYPTKEALPQTGNRQGDLRFVLNTTGDPYEYLWFDNKWISLGGDLSEYAKKSEVNPRLNALELKAHTHVNKNVLDRLTANVIDDSHKHANKNVLDATTAPYTTQDKATLDELAAITVFEGATKTEDGTMGYVPAPLQGQHTYFLKGDGTWAYLDPGDKYKAGEGIYILSGEVTTQTFPFKLYAKGGYVKQYIIYGAPGGVGDYNSTTGKYHIPIRVSAEGHTPIETVIQIDQKLYENDWINFELQEYSVYRTNLTNDFRNLGNQQCFLAINQDGSIEGMPGSWGYQDGVSDYYEMDPDAIYELPIDTRAISWRSNVNIYDANKNRTRTILRSNTSVVNIIPQPGEKYLRIAAEVGAWEGGRFNERLYKDPVLFRLKDTVFPVTIPLQQIQLIPNAINTIDVLTTNKPLDVYMETYIPEEPDPEDPLSGYSGIIYNDGVLDVTQEDPNNLNELTVHFRENVEKTLTIPTYDLPIASDTTLGGIKVGDGLSIDQYGELSVDEMTGADGTNAGTAGIVPAPGATDNTKFLRGDGTWVEVSSGGGSEYVEGNGIEFIPSSVTPTGYQTVEYIQSTGTQAIILGYTPSSQNVKIELTFSDINNSASGWHYMYGGWDSDSIRPPSVAYQQNGSSLVVAIGNGLAIQNGEYPSTSGVHTSILTTLNGNYVSLQLDSGTTRSSSFSGSIYRPMAVFAQTNSAGTTVAEFGSYKFHEMKIYEDDILIHHYYPCYRLSDDEIGIYDIIENVFLTNSGTGTFIRSNTPVYIDGPDSINAKLGDGLSFDSNDAITIDEMTGATSLVDGTSGAVPAPLAGDEEKFLRGDGTWAEVSGGTEYAAGDGIQIDEGTSVIDITSIQWQQGKIDDADGSEDITGVEPYLDCEMFEITSHTSMVTLSGTYDNNIMLLWKPYYYDENDEYISTVNTWSTYMDGVQMPINAKYVRFVLTEDETTTLDPSDLAHVEIEYPLEVGKEVITNTGVIDVQVRDRKLIITKHNTIEEIPIPDPPLATTSTPGIVTVGQDLTIDQNGVLNIADINRMILNVEE